MNEKREQLEVLIERAKSNGARIYAKPFNVPYRTPGVTFFFDWGLNERGHPIDPRVFNNSTINSCEVHEAWLYIASQGYLGGSG